MRSHFLLTTIVILGLGSLVTPASAAFPDVPASHPNAEAIAYVQAQGIVQGYPDGTFRPDRTINRAEFLKILVGAYLTDDPSIPCDVSGRLLDVSRDAWYHRSICMAHRAFWIEGYPDGTFKPAQFINFAEAAKIITKTYSMPTAATTPWYKSAVQALEERNAIPTSITSFDQRITRGEMTEMVWRLRQVIQHKPSRTYEELAGPVAQQWQTVRMGGYTVEVPQTWTVGPSTSFNIHTSYRSFTDGSGKEIARFYCPPPEIGYQGTFIAESKTRLLSSNGVSAVVTLDRRDPAPGIGWVPDASHSYHLRLTDERETWEKSCQMNSWLAEGETGGAPADIWQHMFESASISTSSSSSVVSVDPQYRLLPLPSATVTNYTRNTVYRYAVTAPSGNSVTLRSQAFTLSGGRWSGPQLRVYTASNFTNQVETWASDDNWTDGDGAMLQGNPVVIPAGETRYLELSIAVGTPADMGFAVTVKLQGLPQVTLESAR